MWDQEAPQIFWKGVVAVVEDGDEIVFEYLYRSFGRVEPMVEGPMRALEILLSRNCSCGVMLLGGKGNVICQRSIGTDRRRR